MTSFCSSFSVLLPDPCYLLLFFPTDVVPMVIAMLQKQLQVLNTNSFPWQGGTPEAPETQTNAVVPSRVTSRGTRKLVDATCRCVLPVAAAFVELFARA